LPDLAGWSLHWLPRRNTPQTPLFEDVEEVGISFFFCTEAMKNELKFEIKAGVLKK
jgi:hypothetical protein